MNIIIVHNLNVILLLLDISIIKINIYNTVTVFAVSLTYFSTVFVVATNVDTQ